MFAVLFRIHSNLFIVFTYSTANLQVWYYFPVLQGSMCAPKKSSGPQSFLVQAQLLRRA